MLTLLRWSARCRPFRHSRRHLACWGLLAIAGCSAQPAPPAATGPAVSVPPTFGNVAQSAAAVPAGGVTPESALASPGSPSSSPVPAHGMGSSRDRLAMLAANYWRPDPGFSVLQFAQFRVVQPAKAATGRCWSELADVISCMGKPRGYIHTTQRYRNFRLSFECRFARPSDLNTDADFKGNTGLLLFVQEPHKVWPASIEVQGKYAEIGAIKANGGAAQPVVHEVPGVRENARGPVGRWMRFDVLALNGALDVKLNGQRIATSEPTALREGFIGFQAEDFPFELRQIQVQELSEQEAAQLRIDHAPSPSALPVEIGPAAVPDASTLPPAPDDAPVSALEAVERPAPRE